MTPSHMYTIYFYYFTQYWVLLFSVYKQSDNMGFSLKSTENLKLHSIDIKQTKIASTMPVPHTPGK